MKETIRTHIASRLLSRGGEIAIGDDEDLLGSGLVDSVGMMSLVLFIEEEFGIDVPPEDVVIENFFSVSTIDAYLRGRRDA